MRLRQGLMWLITAATSLTIISVVTLIARRKKEEKIHRLPAIDSILIKKKERILQLYAKRRLIKAYDIALGFDPVGPKEREGDGKTPEGSYHIAYKNPRSQFHLSLKISYPSTKDRRNARLKKYAPGGDIMIHGLGKDYAHLGKTHTQRDWTLGCVAVTNEEIKEIYDAVSTGTKVDIKP
jgi:murein L,D-transpeptidase YafK